MRKSTVAATLLVTAAAFAIDTTGMDKSVHPGDDFFEYANGDWVKSTPIPADRPDYGSFDVISEEADKRTAELIQNAKHSKVADFFAAFMDDKAIEAHGMKPIEPELHTIANIRSRRALAEYIGKQIRADVDPQNNTNFRTDRVFGVWVSPALTNPERNAAYLLQGGLSLPNRENYLRTDAKSTELQQKFREHIAAVLELGGFGEVDARAKHIYDFEHKIAEAHVSRTDSEDVHKANNPWTPKEFAKKAPGLEWTGFFRAAGLAGQPYIIVWQPHGIVGISALAKSEPLEGWRDYLAFHALDRNSFLLPKRFDDERFHFYGTVLAGIPEQRARWKRAVGGTDGALGDEVGKMYVAHYFPAEAKQKAQAMVNNIVAAFGRRIDNLTWMTPATRAKAKEKLATLYVGIGYPEKWRDYSGLDVKREDAYGNFARASLFNYRRAIANVRERPDPKEWWLEPQTVNALNVPLQNALNFPAAILNPPFYDPNRDDVENYGAIGAVIGHEISHSFDDQGSQFDEHGRLANWWTKEDFAHFEAAADRLAKQFDAYEPLPGIRENGKLTLSENIADVAGLSAAYDGYRAAYGGKEAPSANGFSGDQRFFLAFAQCWRAKIRPEFIRQLVLTDGHALPWYRADTVRNIDEWYAAFDVTPERKLYLAPGDRVRVW